MDGTSLGYAGAGAVTGALGFNVVAQKSLAKVSRIDADTTLTLAERIAGKGGPLKLAGATAKAGLVLGIAGVALIGAGALISWRTSPR